MRTTIAKCAKQTTFWIRTVYFQRTIGGALKIEPSVEKELKKDLKASDFKSVITGYRIEGRMMIRRHAILEIPRPKANFATFGWCLCALTLTWRKAHVTTAEVPARNVTLALLSRINSQRVRKQSFERVLRGVFCQKPTQNGKASKQR